MLALPRRPRELFRLAARVDFTALVVYQCSKFRVYLIILATYEIFVQCCIHPLRNWSFSDAERVSSNDAGLPSSFGALDLPQRCGRVCWWNRSINSEIEEGRGVWTHRTALRLFSGSYTYGPECV